MSFWKIFGKKKSKSGKGHPDEKTKVTHQETLPTSTRVDHSVDASHLRKEPHHHRHHHAKEATDTRIQKLDSPHHHTKEPTASRVPQSESAHHHHKEPTHNAVPQSDSPHHHRKEATHTRVQHESPHRYGKEPTDTRVKKSTNLRAPPTRDHDDLHDIDLETMNLPFPVDGHKARNLSISRSGRHKVKSRLRMSVVADDVYHTSADVTSGRHAPNTSPRTTASSHRPITTNNNLSKGTGANSSPYTKRSNAFIGGSGKKDSYGCRGDSKSIQSSRAVFAARAPTAV